MSPKNLYRLLTNHPLNRDHKIASLLRFAKWQIGSRLVPGAVVYDWVNGSKFVVRNGEMGLTPNIYTGLCEFEDMSFVLHFARSEDFFVDVGANAGSYTILACGVGGASGMAFEPVPNTYSRLCENVRINHLEQRVVCINKGVGANHEKLAFTSGSDAMNHALAAGEQRQDVIEVDVTPLDDALQGMCPTLLKIDVEGFESPVIEGAAQTLANPALKAVVLELNGNGSRYGYDEATILQKMLDFGFETYSYAPFERKLINLEGKNLKSGNTLFLRDLPMIERRLADGPEIVTALKRI
ncbi:MAG: FkbM family methyltransferase [Planctomycetales bacterium]|nr:FkbM family methyltransferase [Planctomycetales bacterium]